MASIDWSALRRCVRTAARSAAEAAAAGAAAVLLASLIWSEPAQRRSIALGAFCAWAVSSAGTAALMAAKSAESSRAFWWAFGSGMASRLAALAGLMIYGSLRGGSIALPALLLAYAFGVLFFLMLEYRHIKLK